jgi:hypothetical protein
MANNKELAIKYGAFIDEVQNGGSHEIRDRENFEIKWVSSARGFGLFARRYILTMIETSQMEKLLVFIPV